MTRRAALRRALRAGLRSAAAAAAAAAALLGACAERRPQPAEPESPRPPVEASASVDRAVATTGDRLHFRLTVDGDPAYEVEIPEVGAAIEGFRIVDSFGEEPVERGGRRIESRVWELRADLVGSYILPSVTVDYRPREGEAGEAGRVSTSEIFVEVESVLPADGSAQDIRGLKPLRPLEATGRWWPAAAAGAALALLAAALYWQRRRRRDPAEAPPEPAHVVAFRALDALRGADFDDRRAVRRFYFDVSEVVRAYVEGRFGLNATDLTTDEILAELPRLGDLDESERERLRGFLEQTDRVKFAEHRPSEEEIERTWEAALGFVEATQPRAGEDEEELAA